MSKVTNTALLIWRIAIYNLDFLFGDTPLNKCENLLLCFFEDSSLLSSFQINTDKVIAIIMIIHAMSEMNEITKEIILFVPEILK